MDLGNNSLLAYTRADADNTLIVIANNSRTAQSIPTARAASYVDLITGEAFDGTVPAMLGVILVEEDDVKEITVDKADLAPAYDPAYIVEERSEEPPVEPEDPTDPTDPTVPEVTDPEETVPEETVPEETEPEEDSTKPAEKPGTEDDSADTGDNSRIGLFTALLAVSLVGIVMLAVIFLKKKRI